MTDEVQAARLVILGEGAERRTIEARIRLHGLEDSVSLPGFVNNPYLRPYYGIGNRGFQRFRRYRGDARDGTTAALRWLDLARRVAMRRVIMRTLRRAIRSEQLWNGNRESVTDLFRLDPAQNVIRAAWVSYPKLRARYLAAMDDPTNVHLRVVRLCSQSYIDAFVD